MAVAEAFARATATITAVPAAKGEVRRTLQLRLQIISSRADGCGQIVSNVESELTEEREFLFCSRIVIVEGRERSCRPN